MVHRYLWICYYQKQMYDEALEEAKKFFATLGMGQFNDALVQRYSNITF